MRSIIGASLLAVLLSSTAIADTSSITSGTGMGILENDYVRAGVNGTAGTFGSSGSVRPGLQYDSTGTGTFPGDSEQGDYLTPGSPFDGFSVMVDGTNYSNNNARSNSITGDGNGLTDGTNNLSWTGGVTSVFDITNTYSLGTTSEYIDITSAITMGTAADDVYFSRHIDPDAMPEAGDTSATDNVLGYGTIPDSNVAFAEATVSRYALGLYSTDSNVDAGISRWSTEADAYTENTVDGDGSNTNSGDNTIGLSWHWTSVASGDILTASYAYIFGPSAFDAADTAITGGAGGGADILTGDFEDVGSATDAAESGGTPDPVITTETVVDSIMPVLTQSQTTHDSSAAAGVQTIDRETTTIVTTPMVTNTYTDGTLTSSAAADSVAVTTVTDPGSFTGRMDQADQMIGLNVHTNTGIAEGITTGRISHDMGNGYSAATRTYGIGHVASTDNNMLVGGGLNRSTTTLTGENSTGSMSTTTLQARVGKALDDKDLTIGVSGHLSNSDLSYSRDIGDFSAAGSTTARDVGLNVTAEKSTGTIRPFAGLTAGKKTTDAWDETGDVQAAMSRLATDETYRYATLGLNLDTGLLNATVSKDFGDSDATRIGLGINHALNDRINIGASANRLLDGNNTSTYVSAGIKIQF